MKKLLFITYAFDHSTPVGVGAQRIVSALAGQGFHVFVIASQNCVIDNPDVELIVKTNFPRFPYFLANVFGNILGRDLFYIFWELKAFWAGLSVLKRNPDIVAIYTRANPISVCHVGLKLKNKFRIPILMHFTDPIPAPIEWNRNIKDRKRMISQMKRVLPQADLVSFGNQHMLNYQEFVLGYPLKEKSFISPDPGSCELRFLPPKKANCDSYSLLFLGNIYGNRNPSHLFEAIGMLANCSIKLFIYGNNKENFPDFVIKKDRTEDICSVMQNMDVLVDIDGDDKTPVFVSSKLKDYLSVNRPILSISPVNSPSRDLLSNLNTVTTTVNDAESIKKALLILMNNDFRDSDYAERKKIISLFDPHVIASRIRSHIQSLALPYDLENSKS